MCILNITIWFTVNVFVFSIQTLINHQHFFFKVSKQNARSHYSQSSIGIPNSYLMNIFHSFSTTYLSSSILSSLVHSSEVSFILREGFSYYDFLDYSPLKSSILTYLGSHLPSIYPFFKIIPYFFLIFYWFNRLSHPTFTRHTQTLAENH